MALNRKDADRVGYTAKVEWYKKRITELETSKIKLDESLQNDKSDFEAYTSTPDELIAILNDLTKKADKLLKRIDDESEKLQIPVDREKQPDVAAAVEKLDAASKGEYVSYELYVALSDQREQAKANIDFNDLIDNITTDSRANSNIIQDRLATGMAQSTKVSPPTVPQDNWLERYANRYLNNIFSWNEHEYDSRKILDYADNYLLMYPDPAYIPWKLRQDVVQERVNVTSLGELWTNFSAFYEQKANKLVGGVKNLVALRPDGTTHDITKRFIKYTNSFFNEIDNIFEMNYAADLICCFFLWAGRLDTKLLKGLRALLQLLELGLSLNFRDILNSLLDIINNIFRGLLLHELMGFIRHIIQRLVDPIKRWLNNPDPRWQKIFTCTPIDEFINHYIVEAIDHVEKLIQSLLENWYKQIEIDHLKNEIKIELFKGQKWAGTFAKILDVIIAALERSAICGTGTSPTNEEMQKLMNAYDIGPTTPYIYAKEEVPNIWNSFIPVTKETLIASIEGTMDEDLIAKAKPKTTVKKETATIGDRAQDKKAMFDDCLKRIAPEDVMQVTEWIEEINAKSQESQ